MDIINIYKKHCHYYFIKFDIVDNVKPYNDSTLFCPAGMQQFKDKFTDIGYKNTIANLQPCIRMNDYDEIGDGTHFLYFNMIGLFSFREMTIKQAIRFWLEFLSKLGLTPDYVTVHSDREYWADYYNEFGITNIVIDDENCTWTDGEIGGYCTEFFKNGIEIGNIVNPLDNCIDVGFGLERLEMLVNGVNHTKEEILKNSAMKIINSGYYPSNTKQGYVLRKIIRAIYKSGSTLEHPYFQQEIDRQDRIIERYNRLKEQHKDKSKEWWFDTHGVDLDELNNK